MRPFFLSLSLVFASLQLFASLEAGEVSRKAYLELMERYPRFIQPIGDFSKGEIQIVTDPDEMATIEKTLGRDVGLVYRDKYWGLVNSACIFPNGSKGVYGALFWIESLEQHPGVAVMAINSEGLIVLNCNFRHATRSWEIELPRGRVNRGEKSEAAAEREAREETGMIVAQLSLLGNMPPDTGLTNTIVPVFLAQVIKRQEAQQEESEAIEEILLLSVKEIKQAFLKGYYECTIRGVAQKVPFRDPFLAYALLQYELRQ